MEQTRAFLERFLFPLDTYMVEDGVRQKVLDKVIPSAFIFTMNCPEDFMEKQFPIDLENAYQLGKRLIQKAMEN
jgi:hypothetical protein